MTKQQARLLLPQTILINQADEFATVLSVGSHVEIMYHGEHVYVEFVDMADWRIY